VGTIRDGNLPVRWVRNQADGGTVRGNRGNLLGRRPAVDRIGEHTNGVFSGIPNRHLPNGWIFGLPNELYLTERGTSFDVSGIPPTSAVPTLRTADLAAGRDPGLDRAIALLSTGRMDSRRR